jgi:hypothetical protein
MNEIAPKKWHQRTEKRHTNNSKLKPQRYHITLRKLKIERENEPISIYTKGTGHKLNIKCKLFSIPTPK